MISKKILELVGKYAEQDIEQHYFDILDEIFSLVNPIDPICTFSLDRNQVLFSTCFELSATTIVGDEVCTSSNWAGKNEKKSFGNFECKWRYCITEK